jgi:hypothetical protein
MLNYKRIYDQLIEKRLTHKLYKSNDLYTENHHIVPRSLGGSDSSDNMVRLTAREHLIAHLLLVKIYEKSGDKNAYHKMLSAMSAMTNLTGDNYYGINNRAVIINSHVYQKIKEAIAKMYSEKFSGENHPHYDKKQIWNIITSKRHYINKDDPIPEGFTDIMPDCLRRTGKDSSTYNKAPIHNIETGEIKQLDKNETPPEGWKWGMPPEVKARLKNTIVNPTLGKRWVQNPTLKQRKLVSPDYVLEEGWEWGKTDKGFISKEEQIKRGKLRRQEKSNARKQERAKNDPVFKNHLENDIFFKTVEEKEKLFSEYYKIYVDIGFEKFKEITGYKYSVHNLLMRFKKYSTEYRAYLENKK